MNPESAKKPKGKPAGPASATPATAGAKPPKIPPPPTVVPPLFRRIDWIAFVVTALVVFAGYAYTLSPDLTLEDSGELAVGSYYCAVPHPPGYPVWTILTYLFTLIFPVSNIAYRVSMASAIFGACGCGLLALIVSRGGSMMLEGISGFAKLERRWEDWFCLVSGFVAGMLLGFNGFMWSQAVIVEVYPISVLSFMGTLALPLRWLYAPQQRKYLYWGAFMFGICFTNHQTLIVATMGVEVLVLAVRPTMGRNLFVVNSVLYVTGLILKQKGMIGMFDANMPLFFIYNVIGIGSLLTASWMAIKTQDMAKDWIPVLIVIACWIAGASFYLFMPVTSMTNPPMNWGYPRTWDGFLHALSRGQYEKTNPTSDIWRFVTQIKMYVEGAIEEFNFVYLAIALIPLFFFPRMQKRERGWIIGLLATYACLAGLLMMLLNPSTDRQSRELTRVFFTASYGIIAMLVGYGLTLLAGWFATDYAGTRLYGLYGGAVATAIAVFGFTLLEKHQPIFRYTSMFGIGLGVATTLAFAFWRTRPPLKALLLIFALMPLYPVMGHWWDNEQRGHRFGFWFGHDMFTPPFTDKENKPLYPEMAKDAVLYGGTDPGRFCPTYMIFCESFIPPEKRFDPKFDRRDVYIITQNALADNTYMNYIRAHYNRNTQNDPMFFQDMLRSQSDRENGTTNLVARALFPADRFFTNLGKDIEDRRRREGVYPKKEIYIATPEDSQRCFSEYITDAQRRLAHDQQFPNEPRQIRPGEDVKILDGRVSVTGQIAVMAINGLLTKVMFDKNPDHEFYVEESFPLDWMFPHLVPYGIIMKINREPVPEITSEMCQKDHEFWSQFSGRLTGNWITTTTPVKDICEFVERVYLHGDFKNFKGDPAFVRDDNAQKAFSKLRSSIAGIYTYRINKSKNVEEQQRMMAEADFAFRQAFSFCPYSPEAVFRYCQLLSSTGHMDDAILIARTCHKFDLENQNVEQLVTQLEGFKKSEPNVDQARQALAGLEAQYRNQPTNHTAAFEFAQRLVQFGNTNRAVQVLEEVLQSPQLDTPTLLAIAKAFVDLNQPSSLEKALQKLVVISPDNPEAWYDFSAIEAAMNKTNASLQALAKAVTLSRDRLAKQPGAKDLLAEATNDPRFNAFRQLPEYQQAIKAP